MANLVTRMDIAYIYDDGTIDIWDTNDVSKEYPFRFRYKLYLSKSENLRNIFGWLFESYPNNYELTPKFKDYIDNRATLFEEISTKYASAVNDIKKLSPEKKKSAYNALDSLLNIMYPYVQKQTS